MKANRSLRAGLTILLAVYGFVLLRDPGRYTWLDSLDLAIHEAGHLVFAFGGETVTALGGTLLQLIVPAVFTGYFLWQGDRYGATVPLWWLGQNCWNISVYVRDARAQVLPLVGGGEHDWGFLLAHWGVLARDQQIGQAVYLAGVLLYLVAILAGMAILSRRPGPGQMEPESGTTL